MTNKEFFDAYCGKPVLYKRKDIGAYVAGYFLNNRISIDNALIYRLLCIINFSFCTKFARFNLLIVI